MFSKKVIARQGQFFGFKGKEICYSYNELTKHIGVFAPKVYKSKKVAPENSWYILK